MARRRFFVPQVRRGGAELTGDDAEHLVRVLRAEAGQLYEISDNEHLYLARITVARKSVVSFEVVEQLATVDPKGTLILVQALIKFDSFEWIVEKATELGVNTIVPFDAVRSERGLMQASTKRRARWERLILEASQQARRLRMPEITESARFEEALQNESSVKILLDEESAAPPILKVLPRAKPDEFSAAVLVGPEGGWTEAEREKALENGWLPCSLGPTILRAETAAIAGLSIVRAWMESSGEA